MADTLTICGVEYAVVFTKGAGCSPPCLTLTTLSASSTSYSGTLDCAGCGYAIFAFGDPDLCTDERADGGPCNNLLRLKVEYSCCPIDGWDGEGWYCIIPPGGDCETAVAVELLDADKCDTEIEICSGPYSTEEEANEVCASVEILLLCPDGLNPRSISSRLYLSFANATGSMTGLDGITVALDAIDYTLVSSGVSTQMYWSGCYRELETGFGGGVNPCWQRFLAVLDCETGDFYWFVGSLGSSCAAIYGGSACTGTVTDWTPGSFTATGTVDAGMANECASATYLPGNADMTVKDTL